MSEITNADCISEDKADFLLSEAKDQLAATVTDADALTKAGVYLLGGLLTVVSALVGITATSFKTGRPIMEQNWGAIIPLIVTILYGAADAAIIMWTALS